MPVFVDTAVAFVHSFPKRQLEGAGRGRGPQDGYPAVRSRARRLAGCGWTRGWALAGPVAGWETPPRPWGLASTRRLRLWGTRSREQERVVLPPRAWLWPRSSSVPAARLLALDCVWQSQGAPQGPRWAPRDPLGARIMGKNQDAQQSFLPGIWALPQLSGGLGLPRCPRWGAVPPNPVPAAYLGHALHVQLHQLCLVHLKKGEAHPEHNLQALQGHGSVRRGPGVPRSCLTPPLGPALPGPGPSWESLPAWGVQEGAYRVLTSYMKISKTRVATGSGKVVRNSVRNQDEAYMDVWKLWARKWVFKSGSCSWGWGSHH